MKIIIRGRANVEVPQAHQDQLATLQAGLVSEDRCTRYFDNEMTELTLHGGQIRLSYDADTGHWHTQTEYVSAKPLSETMIRKLVDATTGQWSDGFGSDCFSEISEALGASIDLYPLDMAEEVRVIVDPQVTVRETETGALSSAARRGDLSQVREFLDAGADIEEESQGSTPLYGAVISGHKDVAIELIRRGADVQVRNVRDEDTLMAAALSTKLPDEDAAVIASALLALGVDAKGKRGDYTPLFMASHRKETELVNVLRQHGATE